MYTINGGHGKIGHFVVVLQLPHVVSWVPGPNLVLPTYQRTNDMGSLLVFYGLILKSHPFAVQCQHTFETLLCIEEDIKFCQIGRGNFFPSSFVSAAVSVLKIDCGLSLFQYYVSSYTSQGFRCFVEE